MSRKKIHGNSRHSKKPHHLYVFYDHKKRTIHKFGISGEPINNSGDSKRMRRQMSLIRTVVEKAGRFTYRVFMTLIPGRRRALEIEDDCVEAYRRKHGRLPRGNENHPFESYKWRSDKTKP